MAETEDKGYTVKDRRYLHMSEEEKARVRQEEEAGQEQEGQPAGPGPESPPWDIPLPGMTFSSFILSLSSSALACLGEIEDPGTGETGKNLPLAKQTIDLLGLLREKTRNNLSKQEENLLESILFDLRMRYVREMP